MNGPGSSKLDLLHFARRVVVQQSTGALDHIDAWIAAKEQRQAARQCAEEMRPTLTRSAYRTRRARRRTGSGEQLVNRYTRCCRFPMYRFQMYRLQTHR